MPRTAIEKVANLQQAVIGEIARIRGLEGKDLRARWRAIFRAEPLAHLSHNLLFRILAYQLQVESFGGLDTEYQRALENSGSADAAGAQQVRRTRIQQGAILSREWKGRIHRVVVLGEGFGWNGRTYPSLTKVAFAITGTHWNGPRFFGLRGEKKSTRKTEG